ncbi:uncharacterized protein LOC143915372 [Arctopsyche grandis]|uniref:uncharacterized protein LOC143915372 n=1 Tax=Arctopsyche grandis TaxID=121162 RepID=UPI00406D9BD6
MKTTILLIALVSMVLAMPFETYSNIDKNSRRGLDGKNVRLICENGNCNLKSFPDNETGMASTEVNKMIDHTPDEAPIEVTTDFTDAKMVEEKQEYNPVTSYGRGIYNGNDEDITYQNVTEKSEDEVKVNERQ